jgi:putative lipoprotein
MRAKGMVGLGASVVVILLAAWAAVRGLAPAEKIRSAVRPEPVLTGTVFYRERIALPPNSTAEVVLEDVSIADRPAVEIARSTVAPAGQVPIAFALRYAPERIEKGHHYAVRAAILWPNGARMFVSTVHYPAFDSTARSDDLAIVVQRVNEAADTADTARVLFECGDDVFFAMRIGTGRATLSAPKFLGNDSIVLQQTEAASGARYTAGDTVFWSKGDVATFQIGGRTFIDCRAAKSGR